MSTLTSSVMLVLYVIGILTIMVGASGGGLFFFLPGIICILIASYLYVKQTPST